MKYPPYQYASVVEDIEIGVDEKLYCVEFLDAKSAGGFDSSGGWMGKTLFATEQEARNTFSILPEFKAEGNTLVIREYVVKKTVKARMGIAGGLYSQINGKNYTGGGIQIQLLDNINYSPTWEDFFVKQELIEGSETIRKYVKRLN
jgi:hypothetical protein